MKKQPERRANAQNLINNYKAVFGSPEGKKVLLDLLKQSRYAEDTFTPDSNVNGYMQGKQSIGVYIMKTLNKE